MGNIDDKLGRISQRKKIQFESQDPYVYCFDRFSELGETVYLIWIANLQDSAKELILKQFIVNAITILEIFLKNFFIYMVDTLKIPNKKPIKDKFNITEIQFITENNITVGEIIGEYSNFQNLDVISALYSEILDCNFFKEIDKLFQKN